MTELEAVIAEQDEQRVLLNQGIEFEIDGKKYLLKQPYLLTLDYAATEMIKLKFDKEALESESNLSIFEEQKRMVKPNARVLARIVAILYLKKRWKIRLFAGYYARKFENGLTPSDMMKLTSIIIKICNFPDFTNSIVLLAVNRTTAPQTMEE